MKYRTHQAELREALASKGAHHLPLNILAWVVPGGGKSYLAGILAQRFEGFKIGWFVPRLSLQSQAVESMAKTFNLAVRDSCNDCNPSRGTRGFVATHAALAANPNLWRDELRRRQYVLVMDECHHLKMSKAGELSPVAKAFAALQAPVTALFTGTLDTNDGSLIYGVHYDADGSKRIVAPEKSADIYIRYDRVTALRERAIVPIEFHRHDGPVRWQKGELPEQSERLSAVERGDESAAIFTALRTEVADQLFHSGVSHWRTNANGGKLIVVLYDQATAKRYATMLSSMGHSVALAIDDNPEAHREVRRFRSEGVQTMVTCQMAYEGLDVPTASHAICLTNIRSAPWIEQMLARVWRASPGKRKCWAFVPDDPRMNRVIAKIAAEQPEVIIDRPNGGSGTGGCGKVERESVLALGSEVDAVNLQFLDGEFADDGISEPLLEMVRGKGLTGDEPEVQALLNRLRLAHVAPKPERTPREMEMDLRKQIADECRARDLRIAQRRGVPPEFGVTQRLLFRLTGKSTTEMTIAELQRAFAKLQSINA